MNNSTDVPVDPVLTGRSSVDIAVVPQALGDGGQATLLHALINDIEASSPATNTAVSMNPVYTTAPLTRNAASNLHGNSAPPPRPVGAAPPVATAAGHGVGGQLHAGSHLPASSSHGPYASQAPAYPVYASMPHGAYGAAFPGHHVQHMPPVYQQATHSTQSALPYMATGMTSAPGHLLPPTAPAHGYGGMSQEFLQTSIERAFASMVSVA